MKIYKEHNLEIYSFNVSRETEKYYWLETHEPAFNWSRRVKKADASLSQEDAIRKAIKHNKVLECNLKHKLTVTEDAIFVLNKLLHETGEEKGE